MIPLPLLIGGERIVTNGTTEVFDPFTGEPCALCCLAGEAELERALQSAQEAFAGAVSEQTLFDRAQILEKTAAGIRRREKEFADLIVTEAGKHIALAEAEVSRAEQTFLFAARAAAEPPGSSLLEMEASAAGRGHMGLVRRFPLGVILAITPFNFPLNLVAHKIAPALATGNAVLLKPSPRTPGCALLLGETLLEAGMPPGQVNVVPCDHALVPGLLDDRRVKMLSFTGSAAVGWSLKGRAARQKVALELGGNAALVLHRDAEWRGRLAMFSAAAFGYAGQSCISVQRIFVHREIYDEFKTAFAAHLRRDVGCGDPRRREVAVGPMIDLAARDRILAWVDDAMKRGAKLLTDLHPKAADRCLPPILLEGMPEGAALSGEEAFGPVALLEAYDDFDQALARVNDSVYGLQAGVFTQDARLAWRAFNRLEVGGVLINQTPTFRVENTPYGGVKDSGHGREGIRSAMEEMTEPRTMIFNLNPP